MGGLHILSTICIHMLIWSQTSAFKIESSADGLPLVSYYDVASGKRFEQAIDQSSREPDKRVSFRANGCSCRQFTCGCCSGINIQQLNFNREGCLNFTYDPFEFSIAMDVFMNDNKVFSNTFSAKNPPPLCIPIGPPYLPSVEFCAKVFDLHMPGQNLQMCLDFETRLERAPVFVLHFDCMRMGTSGFALVKPGATLPPTANSTSSTTAAPSVTDVDTYDEVTEALCYGLTDQKRLVLRLLRSQKCAHM